MAEELGKIEKPTVESIKKGRKLFFVPLVFRSDEPPDEYLEKYETYWEQVQNQLFELAVKLGDVNRIYHELIAAAGEEGAKVLKDLNEKSHRIVETFMEKKASFEGLEENETLTEFMDWNRCLMIGLQSPKVVTRVYDAYVETSKKRNELLAKKIDETLKPDEIGILIMRENHQMQFPADIQVFYVAPPALDEIKRWLRDREGKTEEG